MGTTATGNYGVRRTMRQLMSLLSGVALAAGLGLGAAAIGSVPAGATTTGATLYVSTTGTDTANTTCAQASPCATIAHALSLAADGDVVSVGPGTFGGGFNVGADVTVEGAGANRTTIADPTANPPIVEVTVDPGVDAIVSDLTVDGSSLNGGIAASTGSLTLDGVAVLDVPFSEPAAVDVEAGGVPGCYSVAGGDVITTTTTNGFAGAFVGETVVTPDLPLPTTVTAVDSPTSITVANTLQLPLQAATVVLGAAAANDTVSVLDSTLGSTGAGGSTADGIYVSGASSTDPSSLAVANSTIANTTGDAGYGQAALVGYNSAVTLTNDTVTANLQGLRLIGSSPLTVGNTILAANSTDCVSLGSGTNRLTDLGHNIVGIAACGFVDGQDGDQVGSASQPLSPGLGALGANGGPTPTAAPMPGSPAIGTADPAICAAAPVNGLDQRGDQRNQASRGTCDVGAYDTGGLAFSQTAITSVTAHPQVGQRIVVKVAVTNPAGATGPAPAGKVTVSDGTQACEAGLTTGSAGSATGRCALVESAPGSYSLTAGYPGDAAYQASATPAATQVTVTKARTMTALTLSTASVVYGHEQSEVFTVTVRPAFAGTPSGTVVVKSGTKRLCTVTLSGGSGTCSPFAKALAVGTDPVVARYTGSTDFRPSTSASASLTVSP